MAGPAGPTPATLVFDEVDAGIGGQTARATVTELRRADVVGELVRMLGAEDGDAAARRHARELLKAA